ncbi:hypothetical protein BFG52_08710 [Acinetobacter larvae]|uniref:Uncharacterized protein n=2 Tax=Acinetobacter larvae TaxID=1789224 RepID=A0A1B2M3Z8_9GAMM|nr:hypothetical protein BFG52_08710 [Acinetobacter larvae]
MYKDDAHNLEQIEAYLDYATEESYLDLISGRNDIVMRVDWRELDEEIIQYCEDILNTEQLSVELVNRDHARGFDLSICYKHKKSVVPFASDAADRDTTIIALNQILQPEYEIRFCLASEGNDCLEFLPLKQSSWERLERKYGATLLQQCFAKVEVGACFFG